MEPSNWRMPLASFDDECNLSDSGEFSKSFHVISPNELQLNRKHQGLHITFLELRWIYIFIVRSIVCMSDLTGRIHVYVSSELLRIAKFTLKFVDFVRKAKHLFLRLMNQKVQIK